MTRFARIDPQAAAPRPVLGWYDTEAADYGDSLPPVDHLVRLTDAQWDQRLDHGWAIAADNGMVAYTPPPAPPQPYEVPKLLVVERLAAAGLLRPAFTALKLDVPMTELSDAELTLRERWNAAVAIHSDDQVVLGFLEAIGADPAAILAST